MKHLKMVKCYFVALLVLCMMVPLLPISATASNETGGNGGHQLTTQEVEGLSRL